MFEVVAANALATVLCPALTAGVNLVRATFLDPGVRELYADWDSVAREAVAGLRATACAETGKPWLADLVTELTDASPDFRQLWNLHEVFPRVAGQRLMHHPLVGTRSSEGFSVLVCRGHLTDVRCRRLVFTLDSGTRQSGAPRARCG